jgi:hypothetical protein
MLNLVVRRETARLLKVKICVYKLVVFSGELSTKMMVQKDERVKVMAEILRGIRVIKLHVWEDHFLDSIGSEYGTALLAVTFNF